MGPGKQLKQKGHAVKEKHRSSVQMLESFSLSQPQQKSFEPLSVSADFT